MPDPFRQANLLKKLDGSLFPAFLRERTAHHRDLNIFAGAEGGQEMEGLKDEANPLGPEGGKVPHFGEGLPPFLI